MPKTSKYEKVDNFDLILEYLSTRLSTNTAVYIKEFNGVQRFGYNGKIPPVKYYTEDRLKEAVNNIIKKLYKKAEADYYKKPTKTHIFHDLVILKILNDE